MSARLDWIAVGPRGVYAIMDAQHARPSDVARFRADAAARGHETDLVTVEEACRRHREFLMQFADMRAADAALRLAAIDMPSFLPSPDQIEMFGEART